MWAIIVALLIVALVLYSCDDGAWDHSSIVVRGKGVAKDIDWKTANLSACPSGITDPGFYSCDTNYGKATLLKDEGPLCEVHIHKFNGTIYGEYLKMKNIVRHNVPYSIKYTNG
jgi:FAD synthase